MAGTKAGSIKAQQTILEKYGREFILERGRQGGLAKVKKGFALMDKEKHKYASIKGGIVKKGPKNVTQ